MGRIVSEIDDIAEREGRQHRAFQSRRNPVLRVRCKQCGDQIGAVFNSDEGLVLVLLSSFGASSRQRKAKIAALKAEGKRWVAKAMGGLTEPIIELLDERADGRVFRHCSQHVRLIDWQYIVEQIDANEPDARI